MDVNVAGVPEVEPFLFKKKRVSTGIFGTSFMKKTVMVIKMNLSSSETCFDNDGMRHCQID